MMKKYVSPALEEQKFAVTELLTESEPPKDNVVPAPPEFWT